MLNGLVWPGLPPNAAGGGRGQAEGMSECEPRDYTMDNVLQRITLYYSSVLLRASTSPVSSGHVFFGVISPPGLVAS